MLRVAFPIVIAFPLFFSCGAQNDSHTTEPSVAETPPKVNSEIEISGHIPDAERQAIVLDRVDRDIHALAMTYPDRDLRVLLEIIAGDSGIHPAKIDLNTELTKPPVSFDDLDVVELVLTIEDMFGATISDEEFNRDFQNPTPNQLLRIIKSKKAR